MNSFSISNTTNLRRACHLDRGVLDYGTCGIHDQHLWVVKEFISFDCEGLGTDNFFDFSTYCHGLAYQVRIRFVAISLKLVPASGQLTDCRREELHKDSWGNCSLGVPQRLKPPRRTLARLATRSDWVLYHSGEILPLTVKVRM